MARFDGGWIKLYRVLTESAAGGRDLFTLGIFVRLLLMANRQESRVMFRGELVTLQPGQLVTGLAELRTDPEEDPYLHRTRNALAYLEKTQSIEQATSNQGRLITICNWSKYQSEETDTSKRQASEAQARRKQSASEAQLNGEVRNKNNTYTSGFEEIYQSYPRREGKSRGFKIYQREIKTPEDRDALLLAIRNYASAKAGSEPKYLKHFATFMGEWRDWLDPEAGNVKSIQPKVTPKRLEDIA